MNAYELLNVARVEAGYEDRIPEINQNNLHELSLLPPDVINDFMNILAKITRQYVYDTTFESEDNPFARFFNQLLPYGYTVEDIYVDLITGTTPAWDDDGSYALSKKHPDTKSIYHSQDYEMQYKVSTSYPQMKTAFLNETAFASVESRIRGTLNSSSQYDLFLQTLQLISTAVIRGAMKLEGGHSIDSQDGIKALLKRAKVLSKDFKVMNNKYNYYSFNTKTAKSDIVILAKPSVLETINVDYLAGVFNLSLAEVNDMIIEMPDGYGWGELDGEDSSIKPLMIIMDKRLLRIFPTLIEGSSIYNPASLVFNTFLTMQYIFSYSLFFNAVCLCEGDLPAINLTHPSSGTYVNGKQLTGSTAPVKNYDIIEIREPDNYTISGFYDGVTNTTPTISITANDFKDGVYRIKVYNTPYNETSLSIVRN